MDYRPLLPKPADSSGPSQGPGLSPIALLPKRKKAAGRTSCDACRARKSACDGQRPSCSTCRVKGTECSYMSRDKLIADETNTELLEKLRTLPEIESIELLRKLRAAVKPTSLLSSVSDTKQQDPDQAPELPAPPSPRHQSPSILAPTASGIELELLTRYPIAYPTLSPVDLDIDSFLQPPLSDSGAREDSYCDDRLNLLDITKWSDVKIPNDLAARIMSFYLKIDHPLLGLFDADLFLRDLVKVQHNFCSSMLVNAVLAWASQAYGAVEVAAATYKDALFEEAMRQCDAEENRNTLTSVACTHLLSLTATSHGKHDLASQYLSDSINMGRRMGLYGATEDGSAKQWLDNHQEWIRSASHTAWGAYCAVTHHSLRFQTALVEAPPLLPIPSEVGSVVERTKGDRFLSYPTPPYMGQAFNKLCELFRIAHKMLWVYYGGDKSQGATPIERVTPEFAEELLRELLEWSASLPLELVRVDGSPHRVILLHTHFHCLILDVLRPFHQRTEPLKLASFEASQDDGDVDAVFNASLDQIKRLVLFYLTKFKAAAYCVLWVSAPLYLLNALIREAKTDSKSKQSGEWHFYFRLCMVGFSRLLRSFEISEELLKGVLCMAVRDGALEQSEATKMFDGMLRETFGDDYYEGANDGKGHGGRSLIVDLDLAMTHLGFEKVVGLPVPGDDLGTGSPRRLN